MEKPVKKLIFLSLMIMADVKLYTNDHKDDFFEKCKTITNAEKFNKRLAEKSGQKLEEVKYASSLLNKWFKKEWQLNFLKERTQNVLSSGLTKKRNGYIVLASGLGLVGTGYVVSSSSGTITGDVDLDTLVTFQITAPCFLGGVALMGAGGYGIMRGRYIQSNAQGILKTLSKIKMRNNRLSKKK